MTIKYYASLIGPLLGVYYPLSNEFDSVQRRMALNTSKLRMLWHSIYTTEEVDQSIQIWGGVKLPDEFAKKLDYGSHAVLGGK